MPENKDNIDILNRFYDAVEELRYNNELNRELLRAIEMLMVRGIKVDCCSGPETFRSLVLASSGIGRAQAVESLRGFIGDAEKITICDPYFFSATEKDREEYIEYINDLIPLKCEKIEIYTNSKNIQEKMITSIGKSLKKKLKVYTTEGIHDRVWLADSLLKRRGCVVGTSLNGIGKKISFILRLPKNDVNDFERELHILRSSGKINRYSPGERSEGE